MLEQTFQAKNYDSNAANSNKLVSSLPGVTLAYITINKTSAHAIGIYDGTDTTTLTNNTLIGTIKASIAEQTLTYRIAMKKGIVLSFPASYAGDITVSYA